MARFSAGDGSRSILLRVVAILLFLVGFGLGPTLHHFAYRSSRWEPFAPFRPVCDTCSTPHPWLGWGRAGCSHRRHKGRQILVAVVAGLGFAGAGWLGGGAPRIAAHLVLAAVSVILLVTDIDQKLIPNRILYPGGGVGVVLLGVAAVMEHRLVEYGWALVMGLGYFVMFWLVAVLARGGFGYGDVKLAALLGVFGGYPGWRTFAMAIFLTGMVGGVPALVLLATGKARAKTELPYGPAMLLGCWAALLFGDRIMGWL